MPISIPRRAALRAALGAAAVAAVPFQVLAQDFPSRPVRFVVAYPPGGSVDAAARLLANAIAPELGQPVVVDNKPGAAGQVGTQVMAATPSDGHTFLVAATAVMSIAPHVRKISFSPERDFIPVARLADTVSLFAGNRNLKANTFEELIAEAKRDGREVRYGYVGAGTITHLFGEIIRRETGVNLLSVPYKGNADNINAVIAGQIDFVIDPTAMSHVKAGTLKALAINAPQRLPDFPDVPTLRESTLKMPEAPSWISLFALKGTPPSTVERVAGLVKKALEDPQIQRKLLTGGLAAHYQSPQEFARQMAQDSQFYAKLIRDNKIVLD